MLHVVICIIHNENPKFYNLMISEDFFLFPIEKSFDNDSSLQQNVTGFTASFTNELLLVIYGMKNLVKPLQWWRCLKSGQCIG